MLVEAAEKAEWVYVSWKTDGRIIECKIEDCGRDTKTVKRSLFQRQRFQQFIRNTLAFNPGASMGPDKKLSTEYERGPASSGDETHMVIPIKEKLERKGVNIWAHE